MERLMDRLTSTCAMASDIVQPVVGELVNAW